MLLTLALIVGVAQGQTSASIPATLPEQSLSGVTALHTKAEAGDASAQFLLGKAFEGGLGVSKNEEEAARWFRKAADQGNAAAEDELGVLLWTGTGVRKDKVQAVQWYQKAAQQGNGSAMFNLAVAYYNAEGGTANVFQAQVWFYIARDHGSTLAADAVQRFEKAASQEGLIAVWHMVAATYAAGRAVPKDYALAFKWYQMCAEKGSTGAAVELARILYDGLSGKPDYNQALRWCQYAADRQNPLGMYCVGRLYQEGKTGPKDPAEAIRWFEKAAAFGDTSSCLQLGRMFWNGEGIKADPVTAYKWTLLGAELLPSEKRSVALQDLGNFQLQMTRKQIKEGAKKAEKFKKTIR